MTTTSCHPQTNGQTERYDQTLATRLRIYTDRNNSDWDKMIQPLTYAYNSQVHRTTNQTPFSLVLTRPPPDIILQEENSFPEPDDMTPEEARLKFMKRTQTLIDSAADRSAKNQAKAKAYHDKRVRRRPQLQVGDHVFVDAPPPWGRPRSNDRRMNPKEC